MLEVIDEKDNAIYYKCTCCGTTGVVYIKKDTKERVIVINVSCINCEECSRFVILQYSDDSSKKEMLDKLNEIDLSWVPSCNQEI